MWYGSCMAYVERTDQFVASLGFEAYRVGGANRDILLGRRVADADYMVRGVSLPELRSALAATGAKVSKLQLRNGAHVGWRAAKKGVGSVEIVLPRAEFSTGPGPGDFEIRVDPSLGTHEDATRRDFTINALYFLLPDGPMNDPTNTGLYDIQHKLIRTTHPDSFSDDPLRMLRALRFVATLGYDLAIDTHDQMAKLSFAATGLTAKGVSGKATEELFKLLEGPSCVKALRLMCDTGVMAVFLPELAPMIGFEQASRYHDLTTDEHTFKALEVAAKVDAPLRVRLALLFHDAGKPEAAWCDEQGRYHYYKPADDHPVVAGRPELFEDHEIISERLWMEAAKRLNVPRAVRNDVAVLVQNHMLPVKTKALGVRVRRNRVKFGDEMLHDLHLMRACDLAGKENRISMNHLMNIQKQEEIRLAAANAGVPTSPKELQITGRDITELGIEGPRVGQIMRRVLDEVVCRPDAQTMAREWQLERARALA